MTRTRSTQRFFRQLAPLVWASCLLPFVALAGATGWLERAQALYADLQYEKCLKATAKGLKESPNDTTRAELLMTRGLCEAQLRRWDDARKSFTLARAADADAELPTLAPPRAKALFAEAGAPTVAPSAPPPSDVADEPSPPSAPPSAVAAAPAVSPSARSEPPTVDAKRSALPEVVDAPLAERPAVNPPIEHEPPAQDVSLAGQRRMSPWPVRVVLGALALGAGAASSALYAQAHGMAALANAEPYQQVAIELGERATGLQTWSGAMLASSAALVVALLGYEVWRALQ